MAYDKHNLSVLAYANGFTLWHYTTTDAATTVDNVGYFNNASEMLRVGDMLLLNCGDKTTISVVAKVEDGNVVLTALVP